MVARIYGRSVVAAAVVLLQGAGCASLSGLSGGTSDASADATAEQAATDSAHADTAADTADSGLPDAGETSNGETGHSDAGSEASPDAEPDTTVDGPLDAGVEAPPESGLDAPQAADADASVPPIINLQANANNMGGMPTSSVVIGSVAAGDAIIVCINYNDSTLTLLSVGDTLGNAYNAVVGPILGNGTEHVVYLAENVLGGSGTTVTATLNGSTESTFEVYVFEYSGLATTNAFDATSFQIGTSTATDGMMSGFAPTSFAHELILGYGEGGDQAAGTGFRQRSSFDGNVIEDKEVFVQGSYQATATEVGVAPWTMILATFRGQ